MALKDWKQKIYNFPNSNNQTIQFKKGDKIIDIRPSGDRSILTPHGRTSPNKYVYSELWDGGEFKLFFKTKSQAIAYAKSYMRKN